MRAGLPRAAGLLASAIFMLATLAYGVVRGDHVPAVAAIWQDARDWAANIAGVHIGSVALSGNHHLTREEVLAIAGITGRTSLLFLDVEQARERLKENPWIADATLLKLYPRELQISIKERAAFALWQKNGAVRVIADDGTMLEPYVAPRLVALPLVVGDGADKRAKEHLGLLDSHPALRDLVRASILVGESSLESATEERARSATARNRHRRSAGAAGFARSGKKSARAGHCHSRPAPSRSDHRAVDGRRCGCPYRGAQGQAEKEGERRMSGLAFGITPKMKPLAPEALGRSRRA